VWVVHTQLKDELSEIGKIKEKHNGSSTPRRVNTITETEKIDVRGGLTKGIQHRRGRACILSHPFNKNNLI
jgi:hypothetical protein